MATTKTAAKPTATAETKPKEEVKASDDNKATAVLKSITSSYEGITKTIPSYGENLGQAGSVTSETIRKTFDGIVAFDRALINCLRANLDNAVEHGRNIAKAPSLANVAEQHKAYVTNQIEMVAGQIKDLTDLAEEQSKAALAPLFDVVDEAVAKSDAKDEDTKKDAA
jgi:hypothetical protein